MTNHPSTYPYWPPPPEREAPLHRWIRRNPRQTTAIAIAALLVLAAVITGSATSDDSDHREYDASGDVVGVTCRSNAELTVGILMEWTGCTASIHNTTGRLQAYMIYLNCHTFASYEPGAIHDLQYVAPDPNPSSQFVKLSRFASQVTYGPQNCTFISATRRNVRPDEL
ncbi:hypothetical protein SAMN05216371_5367 [Streptomyces sp. TLI_053]|uniref:hypothetical protein n=1 Tax=Streptomyces sp. TLI_053 TaxID=1855352 RepID=UPI0008797717|nr:hypothetical protein [Streptomyces sp. TLI_053]SDT77211.1 hypothetical protein SAMN05216371_5367 [Streptomyces sp. TLI_053]